MKLTESQLRTIIKNELKNIIKENEAQPEQQNSGLSDQVQTLFKQIQSLDSKVKADKELGAEYPGLVKRFFDYYMSGNSRSLNLDKVENTVIVPLAAVAGWMMMHGKNS